MSPTTLTVDVDSHIQRVVLATEETTVTERVAAMGLYKMPILHVWLTCILVIKSIINISHKWRELVSSGHFLVCRRLDAMLFFSGSVCVC